jgi:uroporphyrinogen decarboxylase
MYIGGRFYMNKRDVVKAALSHQECEKVPYCINLTFPAYDSYGEELLKKYASPKIIQDLSEGVLTRNEAISLAMGNYMFCINSPWWSWYDIPECYKEYDAPEMLPKTIGHGSYENFFEKIKYIKEQYGCYILVMVYGSHFEKANEARGIENFLGDLAGEKEFAARLLNFIIEKNMVMLQNIVSVPEIDGILLGSDWGTQLSLLMSPAIWKELIAPGEQREYDLLRENGKDVWIHSCGNIKLLLPELTAMGVHALNPIQPECMDIYELKDRFGDKLTFWGGISTQRTLPYGTPEQVSEESHKVIRRMKKNGGYITAPSQEIQMDVPLENLIALIESARKFG